jgi:small subunit ribosomal protein S6
LVDGILGCGKGFIVANLGLKSQIKYYIYSFPITFALQFLFFNKIRREMNNYELMVIFTPVLSDDEFKNAQKKYTSLVTENGGQIVAENPWGLKSLAYPIQKKTTGLYWVVEFTAPSDFNEKLKIQLLRDESVLRHLTTKLDKYAVEYNAKKRSGVPTGTEKATEV